jgi:hypothetical protein
VFTDSGYVEDWHLARGPNLGMSLNDVGEGLDDLRT